MTKENECRKLHSSTNLAARGLFTAIVAMTVAFLVPAAQAAQGKTMEATQVYQHTYDEVFEASQAAVERLGYVVTDKDKDKGTISGAGMNPTILGVEITFDIRIEALNSKPETRVTVGARLKKRPLLGGGPGAFLERYLSELPKVLATYR